MGNKTKFFLVLALICTGALLALSAFFFLNTRRQVRTSVQNSLQQEYAGASDEYSSVLGKRKQELLRLASTTNPIQANLQIQVRESLRQLMQLERSYTSIVLFGPDKSLLVIAERPAADSNEVVYRHTGIAIPGIESDARLWSAKPTDVFCGVGGQLPSGKSLRCATPWGTQGTGWFVSEINLDILLKEIARRTEAQANQVFVLDRAGEILYHTNDALKHQQAHDMASFKPVTAAMSADSSGAVSIEGQDGHEWLTIFGPLESRELSLGIAGNYSEAISEAQRTNWLNVALAILLGLGMAALVMFYYQQQFLRQSRSLERVTRDVEAIAKGEVNLRIEALSRDDIRPLAESMNLVTSQLRQQLAREAETRQFQSFIRLSAMLTHDLKNAIGSLSLLVSNMEQHFDNEEFRADALKALTGATEKLQGLVARISEPVATLSGEFRRPLPVDLVPMIKHVVDQTAGPMKANHQVEVRLPPSLVALADGERIEKVIENLVLNAFEAMSGKTGKLTIEAGKETGDKVWIRIADTGIGMSQRFIEEKLFHAFATTKKHGMGLGLFTCREVVQAHGGTLDVESKQGVGTVFRVVLPSAPPDKELSKGNKKSTNSR